MLIILPTKLITSTSNKIRISTIPIQAALSRGPFFLITIKQLVQDFFPYLKANLSSWGNKKL